MKILITGVNGFVGSYLAEYLVRHYPKSKIYGLVRQGGNIANLLGIKNKIKLIEGDILNYKKIASLMKLIKPNWVFHLAAKISSRYIKEASEQMMETNIIGTLYLLKVAKDHTPKARIFVASSAAVYGNPPYSYFPIKEICPVDPIDAYGSSKACSEI